ncbi:MAG: 30S ribosomal protein S13 [Gammaproteobacteria bacterium]|nr:30S ribosomal protein S13 [Gammaproteobacteria bacterium]
MTRIAGVNIPATKHIVIGLQEIYGIGPTLAKLLCEKSNVDGVIKGKDLTEAQAESIRQMISQLKLVVEGDLRRETTMNIKRLVDTGTYRGMRHKKGLPTRGQRTRTNARTRKGKIKRVIKAAAAKE